MSRFYRLAYRIGFTPWEEPEDSTFVRKTLELFEREEDGRKPPYGRALDLGTGNGVWAIKLAERGWEVTGVDNVETALREARERAKQADVEVRFVEGDLTNLRESDVGSGFKLLVDNGAFHSLKKGGERQAMGREVSAVAADDATLLLVAWRPRRGRGPFPGGASRSEIEAAFPDWTVTDVVPSGLKPPKPIEVLLSPDEHWYRLVRQ
jgi:SAM-dependent methyltransferase